MTLRPLLSLRSPADFADWFRAGSEYTLRVARSLDLDTGSFESDYRRGLTAMRENETEIDPEIARIVAGTLLGDAAFGRPYLPWTPRWYRLLLSGPVALADRRLSAVAEPYAERARADGDGPVERPDFSRPSDVTLDGTPLSAVLSELSFAERFLLADAILHVEWFRDVARHCGIAVPESLLDRTIRESAAYYSGRRATLSPPVRRVQHALFADDAWVRDVDVSYRLNSTLLGLWERILRRERRRLSDEIAAE
ncbi:MAG: hypothetical protein ABEI99_03370 [Halobaculum sp.]